MCYNLAVKFKGCAMCGADRLAWPMRNDNAEEVEMNKSSLRAELCCLLR